MHSEGPTPLRCPQKGRRVSNLKETHPLWENWRLGRRKKRNLFAISQPRATASDFGSLNSHQAYNLISPLPPHLTPLIWQQLFLMLRFIAVVFSVVYKALGVLGTLSWGPWGENYFHNNTKKLFALFTLILWRASQRQRGLSC